MTGENKERKRGKEKRRIGGKGWDGEKGYEVGVKGKDKGGGGCENRRKNKYEGRGSGKTEKGRAGRRSGNRSEMGRSTGGEKFAMGGMREDWDMRDE